MHDVDRCKAGLEAVANLRHLKFLADHLDKREAYWKKEMKNVRKQQKAR